MVDCGLVTGKWYLIYYSVFRNEYNLKSQILNIYFRPKFVTLHLYMKRKLQMKARHRINTNDGVKSLINKYTKVLGTLYADPLLSQVLCFND